jgi:hypothetical protein
MDSRGCVGKNKFVELDVDRNFDDASFLYVDAVTFGLSVIADQKS